MEIVGALLAGCFIGAVLGFIGAGGAMLSVPILIYGFNFSPAHATTAALAIVFSAAVSGLISKFRSKDVLIKEALVIWALGLVTNLGGSWVAHRLPDSFITTGFAIVMISAATSMLFRSLGGNEKKIPVVALVLISLTIGLMTGLFGIGGGFLAIPVLILFFNNTANKAAGTSLFIIALNTLTAFFGHYRIWSQISWHLPILMSVSAVVVAGFASRMGELSNPLLMRRSFAVLLYAVSIFTIIQTWLLN
jgi:uncharacterized membrane protein YfcA